MQIVANGAHHHLAGVEPHTDVQLQAVAAAHLLRVGAHGGLHGQGGIAGAQGVIFVGNRGAKEGHDAIAEHLVHRALEAVHGVHHAVEGGVQQLLGGFWIEAADELRRIFDVGEEHRDLLAFTFQSTLRSQDLLGEIRRGIGQWGTRLVCGRRRSGRRSWTGFPGPDQAPTVVSDHVWVGVQEFVLEIFEGVIIQGELPFERAIGDAAAPLEHGNYVIENLLEGHGRPSTMLACVPRKRNGRQGRVSLIRAQGVYQEYREVAGEMASLSGAPDLGQSASSPTRLTHGPWPQVTWGASPPWSSRCAVRNQDCSLGEGEANTWRPRANLPL